ncbi:uncharacterized protein MELLADRAFT_95038 [Melampsora larici-populina 98AG31]|uniref:Uncharacterized protein n=1 Tax=Melampsora larici-populina (strain 98AG31 / pathotype 3-4-7) TaxID=747676 RepID=F4S8W2_MELLP|nr:uncharacterized protein MELLADRAFT_95038 [Melampsora larici-populina 98AG31]EGF98919.1 hypothetical protein MELLADRAFT_95038 [Melampsora larici-populina 98AG31]
MTIKTKSKPTNQQIKSKNINQIKSIRSKPVVIIPPFKTHKEKQSNPLESENKPIRKTLEKTLYELPKIGKIDADFISRQTRSKAFETSFKPIIKPTNDKLKSDSDHVVEVSKRARKPLGERDESYVPIVVIPAYHEIQRTSTDPISDPTISLNSINLQTYSKSSTNLLQKWLKEIEIENLLDPNHNQEIKHSHTSLGLTNDSISNFTSSPSIELVTFSKSNYNLPSNQPLQSTSKAIEINDNKSFSLSSQVDPSIKKVMTKALSKPIPNPNVPPSHTESSLEYIDPITYNPTPTPPHHLSLPKLNELPNLNLTQDSPNRSVSTLKRNRIKSLNSNSNSERTSIILDQDGFPISSQRYQQIHQELNDPFGFQQNEKRLKLLRSKGELERTQPNPSKLKSTVPLGTAGPSVNHKSHLKNHVHLSMDSDLSLTDLLSIKRPNKNQKGKPNHRVIKKAADPRDQKHLGTQSDENEVDDPPLRRGRSKKIPRIISPSSKRPTDKDSQAESLNSSNHKPSPKKLQRLDPNRLPNKRTQAEVHSSPSPKKPFLKSNQLKKLPKPKPMINQTQVKRLNQAKKSNQVFETSRELRVKYYDGLDQFDFEEEIVL